MLRRTLALVALLSLSACSDPSPTPSVTDSGARTDVTASPDVSLDAGAVDAVAADAPSRDSAAGDATTATDGPSGDILGTLSGSCGVIAAMLHSPSPSRVENLLVFAPPERWERAALSPDGQRLFDTANAGGSSFESETIAFEVLRYCDGASLVATETEIHYAPPDDAGANSITDILVRIGGERVGVSVTRAYRPMPMVFGDAEARSLLTTKLAGINRSSMRVLPDHRWVKQILAVLAVDANAAAAIARVWPTLDATLRADTIVLVTVTRGGGFIYCNPDPPLGSECPSL